MNMEAMLQFAVQSVQWTYSLFWRFSAQQRMLVWENGFYNGPIKTTKTLHTAAAAATTQHHHQHSSSLLLHRTHQLMDLYNSLSSAGDTLRRPTSAALSPEDLTESEWFYLLCLSFSFPPGFGLAGKAYLKKKHMWITSANEIDSKIFSRAILAKSAGIKTVVCIPVMDGVVEVGTTDKVKEDISFIQHIKSIFLGTDQRQYEAQKPALSELSTSNSATSMEHYYYKHLFYTNRKELEDEMDSDSSTSNSSNSNVAGGGGRGYPCWPSTVAIAAAGEPSELLMQLEPSEDIRLGSPDNASNNFLPNMSHSHSPPPDLTNFDYHLNPHPPSKTNTTTQLQLPNPGYSSAAVAVIAENQDVHYSNMLSAILNQNYQSSRWLDSSATCSITCSTQSAFSKWTRRSDDLYRVPAGIASTSQCLLKSILHTIPFLHTKHHRDYNPSKSCDSQCQNGLSQDLLACHDSLNDKFIILRSAVPFATEMDNTSILGDTVEYLEQLRQKIQDLEAQNQEFESSRTSFQELQRNKAVPRTCLDRRKLRILEGVGDGCTRHRVLKLPSPLTSLDTNLQVSIIGTDGLLEVQCPYKEGLLLDILLILQGLRIEATTVKSSVSNGVFTAELHAKVKEKTDGKKASILEVKSAIQQILPCVDTSA